jgi:hypothetical protein
MGRLDDIAARNRTANRRVRGKFLVMVAIGACLALILGMLLFTDLGKPAAPKRTHADGILLRSR